MRSHDEACDVHTPTVSALHAEYNVPPLVDFVPIYEVGGQLWGVGRDLLKEVISEMEVRLGEYTQGTCLRTLFEVMWWTLEVSSIPIKSYRAWLQTGGDGLVLLHCWEYE